MSQRNQATPPATRMENDKKEVCSVDSTAQHLQDLVLNNSQTKDKSREDEKQWPSSSNFDLESTARRWDVAPMDLGSESSGSCESMDWEPEESTLMGCHWENEQKILREKENIRSMLGTKYTIDFDPQCKSPSWQGSGIIDNLCAPYMCRDKSVLHLLAYRYGAGQLEFRPHGAKILASLLDKGLWDVVSSCSSPQSFDEFCSRGVLRLVCPSVERTEFFGWTIKNHVVPKLQSKTPMLILGLKNGGEPYGHATTCLLQLEKESVIIACEKEIFEAYTEVEVYELGDKNLDPQVRPLLPGRSPK